eukprot:TRINITY_DN10617_c0_g1_i3.p1 TRINITY_DN10617_c0_g1~~TRINITY_DN10617_c0_g1_i3.p1  ORF type:complete len:176 (-),score=17.81 TRINITY_DN10617_c0_g1_i3:7-534(-)
MALSTADLQTIYNLLINAMSAEESVRKPAEAALLTYESRPGFCSCLVEIISTKDLDNQNNARWLASVYFKNSINRYWRQRRESIVISGVEKLYLHLLGVHSMRHICLPSEIKFPSDLVLLTLCSKFDQFPSLRGLAQLQELKLYGNLCHASSIEIFKLKLLCEVGNIACHDRKSI